MSGNLAEKYGRALEELPADNLDALKDVKVGRDVAPQELGGFGTDEKSLIAQYNGREASASVAEKYGAPAPDKSAEPDKTREHEKARDKEPGE